MEFLFKIINVIIYIMGLGILAFIVGRIIPKRMMEYTKFPFRSFSWEKDGKIYNALKINTWQKKVPDMSRLFAGLMPAKSILSSPDLYTLVLMIKETCMAEATHFFLAVLGFLIPVICPGLLGWIIAAVYIVFGNVAFIVIQRYNRPRLIDLYEMKRSIKQKNPTDVLILSVNTGGGHNSVARTVKKYYMDRGYTVDIEDALKFKSQEYSKFISNTHSFVYLHMPWLFGLGWHFVENSRHLQFGEYSFNRIGFRAGCAEMNRCIADNGYKIVICTHVFASLMLGDTVKRYGLKIATGRVETDYMNTPGVEFAHIDRHFVPHYMMIPQMVGRGVDRKSIVVSGIPVSEDLYTAADRKKAKAEYGIPQDMMHILVMFGTEGNGPVEEILGRLKAELEYPVYITVVCGRNEKLRTRLMERYGGEKNMNICGFVSNIPEIMDSADIFIGKSGGISITEAAAKKLAIVVVKAVGGCEKYNMEFFENHGAAISVMSAKYIAKECRMLIQDDELRTGISSAAYDLVHSGSTGIIYDTMTADAAG